MISPKTNIHAFFGTAYGKTLWRRLIFFYEQPDSVLIAVPNLIVVRKQLKKEEHKLRMRIRNGLIVKYFPEMDQHWGSCLEENLAIVRWYLDPRKIAGTDFNLFVRHVISTGRGLMNLLMRCACRPSRFNNVETWISDGTIMDWLTSR